MHKLTAERDELEQQLNILLSKRPTDLWVEDLDKFLVGLKAVREEEEEAIATNARVCGKGKGKKAPMKRAAKESDDEADDLDDDDGVFDLRL